MMQPPASSLPAITWPGCITSYDKKKLPELLAYYESKGGAVVTLSQVTGA